MLINHNRFKKIFSEEDLDNWEEKDKILHQFPHTNRTYYNFFNGLGKKYKFIETKCLCKKDNDEFVSRVDRHGLKFEIVVCRECGLIRAYKYFTSDDAFDFYKNHYRDTKGDNPEYYKPEIFYQNQTHRGEIIYNFLKQKLNKPIENFSILDYGGGAGGLLDKFISKNDVYLYEIYEPYINYARSKKINFYKNDETKKFDIIILSHVMEHWVDFEKEISKIIKLQKNNKTINFIEFPGIDSLLTGRRGADFLGEIHIPHNYYFQTNVFENIMERYGFKKIYMNNNITALFVYEDKILSFKNEYNKVKNILLLAEKKRRTRVFINIIKFLLKKIKIFNFLKKILGNLKKL